MIKYYYIIQYKKTLEKNHGQFLKSSLKRQIIIINFGANFEEKLKIIILMNEKLI